MQQIQILHIYFDRQTKIQSPVYCPLTGELLSPSDPYKELESFPKSVFAAYSMDAYDCEPFYLNPTVPSDFFADVENFEDIIEKLKGADNKAFIVLKVMHYGIIPGDAGGITYILEVPEALITK